MKAGFASVQITPPLGTTMMGFSTRDRDHGCEGVHDDLFVRSLYLCHGDQEVLIMGLDLCFLDRDEADRLKGAIGRRIDLAPRQILLNTSHTHVGPATHRWAFGDYCALPDRFYLRELAAAVVSAACEAREAAREVTMWAGATRSALPISRRKKDEQGRVFWGPNPDGVVYESLPICLFKDLAGEPVALLFSVSCHPSTIGGYEISADYPGVAMERLDAYLGTAASLFLQGTGGDTKASVTVEDGRWRGTWEGVEKAGAMVAQEVIDAVEAGLAQVEPHIRTCSIEMDWPLDPDIGRSGYEALLADSETDDLKRMWAERQIACIDHGGRLPTSAIITAHGVQIAQGIRLVGLEGEAVAELGHLIFNFYRKGVTFPLGYTDGAQLYLPTSGMMDEGGYEVSSYHEYGYPAPLAKGVEQILEKTLRRLKEHGVE